MNSNKQFLGFICFLFCFICAFAKAADPIPKDPKEFCAYSLKKIKGKFNEKKINKICSEIKVMDECKSNSGFPIYHYEKTASVATAKHILVFALTHGDE